MTLRAPSSENSTKRRILPVALTLAASVALMGCSTTKEANSGSWSDPLGSESYNGPENFVISSISDGSTAKLAGCVATESMGIEGVATLGTGFTESQDGVYLIGRNYILDSARFGSVDPVLATQIQNPDLINQMDSVRDTVVTSHGDYQVQCATSVDIATTEFMGLDGAVIEPQPGDVLHRNSASSFLVLQEYQG